MAGTLNNRDLFEGDPLELDGELEALPTELERIWPKLLVDLLEVASAGLVDAGAKEERAREIATIVLRSIARYHGGRSHYLPTGEALDEALKHYRIWKESGKVSVRDLSIKYDVSEVHIYRIIKRQSRLARARVQPDLFQPENSKTNCG